MQMTLAQIEATAAAHERRRRRVMCEQLQRDHVLCQHLYALIGADPNQTQYPELIEGLSDG